MTRSESPYTLRIVDAAGIIHASPLEATVTEVAWELNGWGHMTFQVPTEDPSTLEMTPLQREAQFWYDSGTGTPSCLWWGPIVSRQAEDDMTTVQCLGLLWYLSRLTFGPVLTNYLVDPDFEDATLAHWTAAGTVTKSSDTAIVRKGSRSLKMVSSAQGLDNFCYQQFALDNSAGTIPVAVFAAARYRITATTGTPYIGPALEERGIFVKRIESGVDQTEATGQVGVWVPLDNSAPRNQWFRMFAPPVSVPAGHIQTIEVRFYSPGGTVNVDTSVAAIEESTGANTATTYADLTAIIANVLAYAQDTTKNKPNLHIGYPTGTFGVTLSRQFEFYDHGNIWNACFKPLIDAGVCDVDITWNSTARTRQLVLYPKKGSVRPELALILGANVGSITYPEDAQQTAAAIMILGQGMANEATVGNETRAKAALDGLNTGYAVDTTVDGGITLDTVIGGAPESTLDQIASQAITELAKRKTPIRAPQFHIVDGSRTVLGVLNVGDTVPFRATKGWVTENQNRRVVAMTLTPDQDVLSVIGN